MSTKTNRPALVGDFEERGVIKKSASVFIALGYPAPYRVGISSLGAQTIYRILNEQPEVSCERFYLGDPEDSAEPTTLESGRSVRRADVLAFSIACETELAGLVRLLDNAGIPPVRSEREGRYAPVVVGGPLLGLDPRLAEPLADVVVVGEGEKAAAAVGRAVALGAKSVQDLSAALRGEDGVWIPGSGEPPAPALAPRECLPAAAAIWTPQAELGELFLVEVARGCPRGCRFCVMSRRARGAGPFRACEPSRVLAAVPDDAPSVGLLGAAVTDHPRLLDIVRPLVDAGKRVSLSSMRADRFDEALAELLSRGGARSLTLAVDGASAKLRELIDKGVCAQDVLRAAQAARRHGIRRLKIYAMLGLPGETDEDVDELAELLLELSGGGGVSASVQAFVPKPGTPLEAEPMCDPGVLKKRFSRLRKRLKGRVRLLPTSIRWSTIDWRLAHGGSRSALAALRAGRAGGDFAAWSEALESLGLSRVRFGRS